MIQYDKQAIINLALNNAIVQAHVSAHKYSKGVTWENMLHSLVVCLAENNNALQVQLIDAVSKQRVVYIERIDL